MTQASPSLLIKRMRVMSGQKVAWDENFHKGINVIRGENSSGKSIILDFLFFALGADVTGWREAALKCNQVFLEVLINGKCVTLSREISTQKSRPMDIFLGDLEASLVAPKDKWQTYPYVRVGGEKESFSQLMFKWLGLPEVASDAGSKLTMHQLLRILYVDQMTPIEQIFRIEARDFPLIRQTIGDLICGAYDHDLYAAQIRFAEANKEFDQARAELASIMDVMRGSQHPLTLSWVDAETLKVKDTLKQTQIEAAQIERDIISVSSSAELSRSEQNGLYDRLVEIQHAIASFKKDRNDLELEIADSEKFISSLKAKIIALQDAKITAGVIKNVSFMTCPSCLAVLEENDNIHACDLCKLPFDTDGTDARILRLISDISVQLRQSDMLQKQRKEDLALASRRLKELEADWELLSGQYKLSVGTVTTDSRAHAKELHRKIGSLEQELVGLKEKALLISRIGELSERKANLQAEISRLADFIKAKEAESSNQLDAAYTLISTNTRNVLTKDLPRQDTFQSAENVQFSFADNRMSVNGQSFFSASSMVFFKNAFMTSLLKSSLDMLSFKHPRILIMDTMEDKGLEEARSHRFQMIMKEWSDESKIDHQIIYATTMIAPDLNNDTYTVGEFYTHEKRTLSVD